MKLYYAIRYSMLQTKVTFVLEAPPLFGYSWLQQALVKLNKKDKKRTAQINTCYYFKARTQYFSEKFRKKGFSDIPIPFKKIFPGNIQLFQNLYWKCLNLRKMSLICVITVTKKYDLLLTLLQVKNTCGIVSKMNEHRLLILINASYMINYQICWLDNFHFAGYNSFSSEICVVLQWKSS